MHYKGLHNHLLENTSFRLFHMSSSSSSMVRRGGGGALTWIKGRRGTRPRHDVKVGRVPCTTARQTAGRLDRPSPGRRLQIRVDVWPYYHHHTCGRSNCAIGSHCEVQATLCVQSAQYRMRSSEIAFLRTVLVWLSTCIPYQLNIVSDYAIAQYRTNASDIAHFVRIV